MTAMKMNAYPTLLLLTLSVGMASAASDKKGFRQQMEKLISMSEEPIQDIPKMVISDDEAYGYCENILSRSEEDYARDTAAVNARLRRSEWILRHQAYLEPKEAKRFKRYDEGRLGYLYLLARMDLEQIPARYQKLTDYCNRMLRLRREARQREMPAGELIGLSYSETGSSRPFTVEYRLQRVEDSGAYRLSGYLPDQNGHDARVVCAVDDSVRQNLRSLIEEHQLYRLLPYYGDLPSFPEHPLPLGGPPSWSLHMDFEGGRLSSGSDGMYSFSGSTELVAYLRQILQQSVPQADSQSEK